MGKDGTQIRTLIHIYIYVDFANIIHFKDRKTAMIFAGQCTTHWLCLHAYYILEVLTTASLSSCVSLQPAFFFVFSLATWMALIWKLGPQCCCCKNFEVHPPFQKLNRWRRKVEATKNGPNFLSVCDEERSLLACYV